MAARCPGARPQGRSSQPVRAVAGLRPRLRGGGLGRRSGADKYQASYDDMGRFIRATPGCTPVDAWRLYRRILVCVLTGNTDAHLKNFAMFHTPDGLRLTPAYDLVAAGLYPEYRQLALAIGNASNLVLETLRPKHLVALSKSYGLDGAVLTEAVKKLAH